MREAAIETAHRYEPMIVAKYGPEQGTVLIANARVDASASGEFDEEVFAECLLDLLPELARIERGRRAAGH